MGNAETSKRFSRRILAQAAMLAVAGLSATLAHAATTDTWVGPSTDVNNTTPTNWATASNWSITNPAAGQTIPDGGTAATGVSPATDALVVNENDANAYQIYFDNFSLAPGPSNYWFTSLTAGNAGVGSVNFNIQNGGFFATSGVRRLTGNSTLNVGTDGGTQGLYHRQRGSHVQQ